MSEWKDTILRKFVSSISETYKFIPNEEVVFLNTSDILLGKVLNRKSESSKGLPGQAKKRIKKGDFLFSEIRPANGRYALIDFDADKYVVSTKLMVLRCNKELDVNYFRFFLTSRELLDYLQMIAEDRSGTFPQITFDHIASLEIKLPPLPEQRAIASILSSLDDKIDLLHRQNATLEKMGETLFRQWFVEEAKEDWEETSLACHTEAFRGLSYKGDGLTDSGSGLPMHNLNSVYEGGGYKFEGIKFYKGEFRNRHLVNPGDIIVTNTEQGHEFRLIGFPAIVPEYFGEKGLFSQHIYKLIPIEGSYLPNEFIYYLLMTPAIREQITAATNGSTVNMLAIDGLQRPEFKLPPKDLVRNFTEIVSNYWKKKTNNQTQIRTLTALRDTLLPKLMSGEVRVEIEKHY